MITITISLECGCCITLTRDAGDFYRPESPQPCAFHMFMAARSVLFVALLGKRVRVGFGGEPPASEQLAD